MLGIRRTISPRTHRTRRILILALALCGIPASTPARAEYGSAKAHFESLSNIERLELMLGLIGTGDFAGLIDFGFTKRFYNSILSFERRRGLAADGILQGWEISKLKEDAAPFYGNIGAQFVVHPFARSKLFVPLSLFDVQNNTEHGLNYERTDKNLSLSFVRYSDTEKSFSALFEQLTSDTKQRRVAYKRLKTDYFVANGVFRGRNFYTWMSAVPGGSTGFTLAWSDQWETMGSRLSILLANSFIPNDDKTPSAPNPPPSQPEPEVANSPDASVQQPTSGTGTGFKVTDQGHVLTNFHVAGECKSITLRRTGELPISGTLVAGDQLNDLALVKANAPLPGSTARFRGGPSPKAGTDISVFGFPLSSILASSGNIVTGNITSLAGIGNDSREYQISAPVQPGNSGGPVLDREGRVVGVVVAKLNALKQAASNGDIPQNVNFAIKGSVATSFMDGTGIAYQMQELGTPLETTAIAELAQSFTWLIECQN